MRKDLWDCIDSVSTKIDTTCEKYFAYRHRESRWRRIFVVVAGCGQEDYGDVGVIGVGGLGSLR